ncbi:MAG TPA: hypothetical protein VKH37_12540, partial [Ferruginibacter sp.]|nr:hypothetical protein [Ferruginibacter sp.]
MATKNITITGRILSNQTKAGIPNLKVEAWDKDALFDDLVGSSVTDDNGKFKIVFTGKYFKELFLDQKPDLYFKIFSGTTLVMSTENDVLWNIEGDQTDIEIFMDTESTPTTDTTSNSRRCVVKGKVSNKNNNPLRGLTVKAFNLDMRSETLLGSSTTDQNGQYKISYAAVRPSRSEKGSADLCMRVYNGDELLFNTGIDDVIFNASENETVNIIIETAIKPKSNEFDNILRQISGLIGDVAVDALQEDEHHADITFLTKETNIE